MQSLFIRTAQVEDLLQLSEFIENYLAAIPDARLSSAGFYLHHPAFEGGENIFLVGDSQGKIIGFAPVFVVWDANPDGTMHPLDIWTIVLAGPGHASAVWVRQMLFERVIEKANALKTRFNLPRIRLAADMMVSQTADIEFLKSNGFVLSEEIDVMRRDPARAMPLVSSPPAVTLQQTRMVSPAEQVDYLAIYHACFPEKPKTVEELQFMMQSPSWENGIVIAAVSPAGKIAGSILGLWDGRQEFALLDDVMVLPEWRGRGIARNLVAEICKYFQARGMGDIRLEVRSTNHPAISVYRSVGFETINQENILSKYL